MLLSMGLQRVRLDLVTEQQRIGIMKSVPENIKLSQDLFHQFLWNTGCLILHPEFPSGAAEVQQLQQLGLPGGSHGRESDCNAGHLDSIPGLGRSPGKGHGNPLQYSCLENPIDRGAWWTTVHGVTNSWADWVTKQSTAHGKHPCCCHSVAGKCSWEMPIYSQQARANV